MERDGADGQPEQPKPRQSYEKQHKAKQAAHRGGPAQASRAGETGTTQCWDKQVSQSPPKRKHTAYSKPSGRLLKKITRKPAKYPQLFRQNKLLTNQPPQDSPQNNKNLICALIPCWTKRPDELRSCALVWLYRLEQPKENKSSGLRSFPKGPLVPLLARGAFLLGSHGRDKDRVGLEVAPILLDNVLLAQRTLQG